MLNAICADKAANIVLAPKFSERPSRGGDDDIVHVDSIEAEGYDEVYVSNDRRYGIRISEITNVLKRGVNAAIIVSDFRVLRRLRETLGEQAVSVYLASAIDREAIRRIHGERHPFAPSDEQRETLGQQFARLKSASRLDLWPDVFLCMSELLTDWSRFIPEARSAEIRAAKIRSFHDRYVQNIALFDHVILNYAAGEPEMMTAQLRNIVTSYDNVARKVRKRWPPVFVVAAASGSGKGLLMEALNTTLGSNSITVIKKMAMRDPKANDRRDGTVAIGASGELPADFDFHWRFHHSDRWSGVKYAVRTGEISSNIERGRQQIVISNMDQFAKFRALVGEHAIFLYLHRLASEDDIRTFQYSRCNTSEEAEQRIGEIRSVHQQYVDRIGEFDHVLLNTAYEEDLIEQMLQLVEHYRGPRNAEAEAHRAS